MPTERPVANGRAALFIPARDIVKTEAMQVIRPGSGIVGYRNHDQMLTAYFEGNRFNDPDLATWAERVRKAYERLVIAAPSVSKLTTASSNLEMVGYIDGRGITIRRIPELCRWLAESNHPETFPESGFIPNAKKTLLSRIASF